MTQDHDKIDVSKLCKSFEILIESKYKCITPPPIYITPFNIEPLDTILGGGLGSGLPIAFTSTPETGKSSIAFQFAATFLNTYENATVIYIDTETASNNPKVDKEKMDIIRQRIETLGIDQTRFKYFPVVTDIPNFFSIVDELITMKRSFREKTGIDAKLLIIWDSMAATHASKEVIVSDPKEIIGYRAREFSLHFTKIKPSLVLENVTFLCIDQVRRNLKIDGRFTKSEKSVGEFGDFKSATSITQLQHNIRQWLFFSKGQELKPSEKYMIDGWLIDCFIEKNKLAPSRYWVTLVFDKKHCLDKVLTEFHFLSNPTITEAKLFDKSDIPLFAENAGGRYKIRVYNPETNAAIGETNTFYLKNLKDLYNNDSQFKAAFDYAVKLSVDYRIRYRLFSLAFNMDD